MEAESLLTFRISMDRNAKSLLCFPEHWEEHLYGSPQSSCSAFESIPSRLMLSRNREE